MAWKNKRSTDAHREGPDLQQKRENQALRGLRLVQDRHERLQQDGQNEDCSRRSEEAKDLKPVKPERKEPKLSEDTLQGYKNSAEFVLERHLRREEALRPGSKPAKTFTTGKGDNAKEEPVFRRMDVEVCRTGESWHKEGRAIKEGELL